MYTVNHEYECENGKVVFDSYQVLFDGILVCESEREAEAVQIAKALNSHDKLVKALEDMLKAAEKINVYESFWILDEVQQAREALAAAKGE